MENQIKPQNQENVNPSTQQDKIRKILEGEVDEPIPETDGTGGHRPVYGVDNVRIEKREDE
ncbi:MAG: hypothetical protein EOO91_13265 [Pedobacter sp.]|nr:MAG: hypothetical protein EOO91_13265 [Pedobacter sp.]